MRLRIEEDDGDLTTAASDGTAEVLFTPKFSSLDSAINGADQVTEAFARYVALLRIRRGDKQPHPMRASGR